MSEDLLLYAQLGYAEHITRLIGEGIDPDWRREDNVTTLMIAALTKRCAIMTALIDGGATVDLQAPDGMTALLAATAYARTTREIEAIELLLQRGADPNLANAEGNDPLMMTARHGLVEAVYVLLRAGADATRKNRFGSTALMQAARGHLVETVRVLLGAGADRHEKDERGWDAEQYARELGRPPPELAVLLSSAEVVIKRKPTDPPMVFVPTPSKRSRFDRDDFKMTLLGVWAEQATEDGFFYVEEDDARSIDVTVSKLPAELDADERHDAIGRTVRDRMRTISAEAPCRFSEVRFAEAHNATQARFYGSPEGGAPFYAVCVYAQPAKFVTLTYRDGRPGLGEEARGRQASESVARFRVK